MTETGCIKSNIPNRTHSIVTSGIGNKMIYVFEGGGERGSKQISPFYPFVRGFKSLIATK